MAKIINTHIVMRVMRRLNKVLVLVCALWSVFPMLSQTVQRVSLVTCGPGKDIYELEGHTALRLTFDNGTDLSVNWGTFDFNSPNFLYRFVKGETDYRMAVYPFSYFLEQYRKEGRWVSERELNLSHEQKQRLAYLIDSTMVKGSPVYRYNYVKDNCATRPLDYLQEATGHNIVLGNDNGLPLRTSTFRDDMYYYHRNYPWYQFGIDLALGSGIDYPLSDYEHDFAPVALDFMLNDASLLDSMGVSVPLAQTNVVLLSQTFGGPQEPTPFFLSPLFVCWLFFGITIVVCSIDVRRKRMSRWFYCLYYSIAGIAGLLLTFLIFISVHEATSPNWLYLWLNPLCFIGALFIWLKKLKEVVFYWQIVNFVALMTLILIAMAGVQKLNPAFYPLIASDALLSLSWVNWCLCKKNNHTC